MSEPQKKLDEAARKLKLPQSNYKLRIIDAKKVESPEKKTPGIALVCEIYDRKPISGIDVNGLTIRTTSWITEKGIEFVNRIRSALGLPLVESGTLHTIDEADYVGATGVARCRGTSEPQLDEETGEKITDPYTGEAKYDVRREIVEWYGRPKEG